MNKYTIRNACRSFCNLRLGTRFTLPTPDRAWLDDWVRDNCFSKDVLSVGVDWYTMRLPELTYTNWWTTIDADKSKAKYGLTSDQHFELSVLDSDALHERLASVDVVILNGVIGYGVNKRDDVERAIDTCYSLLAPGGKLLIGYNDTTAINEVGTLFLLASLPGKATVVGKHKFLEIEQYE